MTKQYKMLEVTISGTYQNHKKETVEFEDVKGLIPFVEDEYAKMHVRGRYAARWIKEAKDEKGNRKYKDAVKRTRSVYVDEIKPTTGELSFVGKDIKKMSFVELQDLATAKNLRFIPVTKGDIRVCRIRAYVDYHDKVLGKERMEWQEKGFSDKFMSLPEIAPSNSDHAIETAKKITNEEIIQAEQDTTNMNDKPEDRFTTEELKTLADEKNIKYHPNIGKKALYKKLFDS